MYISLSLYIYIYICIHTYAYIMCIYIVSNRSTGSRLSNFDKRIRQSVHTMFEAMLYK